MMSRAHGALTVSCNINNQSSLSSICIQPIFRSYFFLIVGPVVNAFYLRKFLSPVLLLHGVVVVFVAPVVNSIYLHELLRQVSHRRTRVDAIMLDQSLAPTAIRRPDHAPKTAAKVQDVSRRKARKSGRGGGVGGRSREEE